PSPGPRSTRNRVKTGKIDTKGLAHHTALDNRAARTGDLDRPEALVRRITEADSQTRHARLAGAGGRGRDLDCAHRPRRPESRWSPRASSARRPDRPRTQDKDPRP